MTEVAIAPRPTSFSCPTSPTASGGAHQADFDAYPAMPAVRDGRIHLIDGKLATWYGPRIAEALRELPPLIRGLGRAEAR